MQALTTTKAPAPVGPYSQAIKTNNLIFLSGQIALNPEGELQNASVTTETQQVLTNLKNVLAAENLNLKNVIKTTIFLTEMADFDAVNAVYADFFDNHQPARACVAVQALPKNARVEIEAIAEIDIRSDSLPLK